MSQIFVVKLTDFTEKKISKIPFFRVHFTGHTDYWKGNTETAAILPGPLPKTAAILPGCRWWPGPGIAAESI